jgi:signal transduction histidine kinase
VPEPSQKPVLQASPPPAGHWPLATWLSVGTLLLVLAALAAMVIASTVAVDRLARRQSLARAELAAGSARLQFQRLGESALNSARTMAASPALASQLRPPANALTLGITLRNACTAAGAMACALREHGRELAVAGSAPWDEVAAAHAAQGERFALAPRSGGAPLLGGSSSVPGSTDVELWSVQALDDAALARPGGPGSARLHVQNIATYQAPPGDPLTNLHSQALGTGGVAVARVPALASDAASVVLDNALGEPVALVDTLLPVAETERTAANYRHAMIAVALVVALVSALAAWLAGRWLAAPVVRLADMARRIGQGDFSPAVPVALPRELRSLGLAMDEMRENLVELTRRLREGEAEARSVVEGVAEGVFVTDAARRIQQANGAFLQLVQQPAGQVIGRFCGDVLYPAAGPDAMPGGAPAGRPCEDQCPILRARTGTAARCVERLVRRDGTTRSVLVTSAPAVGDRQVQLLRDDTELEAARRARDGVLGHISHEFRTPLASQLAAIELLRAHLAPQGNAEQLGLLENVERGGVRLLRLVDNLLESVRIEAGHVGLRRQPLDLGQAATEAAALLAPLYSQARMRLELDEPALGGLHLQGDLPRLQQVYVNLLANALKFAPEGSTVRVGGRQQEGEVESWVEDEGAGLPPGDAAALFERFRRGADQEPAAPGLGLGLWIVRSIVERHGGRAWAERIAASGTVPARTRFSFRIPGTP